MPLAEKFSYSQALQLNRICSDSLSFGNRFNNLKSWLIEVFGEKMMEKELLQARSCPQKRTIRKDAYRIDATKMQRKESLKFFLMQPTQ